MWHKNYFSIINMTYFVIILIYLEIYDKFRLFKYNNIDITVISPVP